MKIESSKEYMTAILPNDVGVVWLKGSHTANVYNYLNNELDVFTFSFEKNKPTAIDFVNATIAHLSYVEAS